MRVVCIPGFTQTAASWDAVRALLPTSWDVVALDVPDGLSFATTAATLADRGGPATYVGYSMGGRLALQLALDHPDSVDRLVLVSATPGIEDLSERAARARADEELAREVARIGVDDFLDRWLAQPLFATLPPDRAGLAERRRANTVARLAHQLTALGQGAQPSLWPWLADLTVPVLAVTGGLDTKYTDLAVRMVQVIGPSARHVVVDGAGHAVHLERPDAVAAAIAEV